MGRKITLTQASKGHNVRLIIRKQMLKRKNTERHRADSLWSLLMISSFEWGMLTGFAVNNLHQLCLHTKDESEKCYSVDIKYDEIKKRFEGICLW